MNCDPKYLAEASRCFCGFSQRESAAAQIYALCWYANHLTPPVGTISWSPSNAEAFWIDVHGIHPQVDLATFLATADLPSVVQINFSPTIPITSLSGLSNCPLLNGLVVNSSLLTTLDLAGCSNLVTLSSTYGANLQAIDNLSDCVNLSTLNLTGNALLTTLDITVLPSIITVVCDNCGLTNLIVAGSSVVSLNCSGNVSLTTLTLTGCTALVTLDSNNCIPCVITGINTCSSLVTANVADNANITLDVHGLLNLDSLNCSSNPLTSLNVSGCTALTYLNIGDTQIAALDVHTCLSLATLWAVSIALTAINTTGCGNLSFLRCYNSSVTSLDLSTSPLLTILDCNTAALTSLNVTGCSAITYLDCSVNTIAVLDVSTCTSLATLKTSENSLTSLIVLGATSLTDVTAQINLMNPAAVDAVLCGLNTNGALNGNVRVDSNSPPTAIGIACADNITGLQFKGWTVTHD
jgi:hypothetical protein